MSASELIDTLADTMQMGTKHGQEAAARLQEARQDDGYCELLAQVIDDEHVDENVRLIAATELKNVVRNHWNPPPESDFRKLSSEDKSLVRDHIVELMINTTNKVQECISEAVSIAAKHDFPDRWGDLLDQLVDRLTTDDYHTAIGVTRTMAAVFRKYRGAELTEDLKGEIIELLEACSQKLFDFFLDIQALVQDNLKNDEALVGYMEVQEQMIHVLFSLSYQDLPPVFEDNLATLMKECHVLLTMSHSALEPVKENEPGLLDRIQAEVINMLAVYAEKYDDVFPDYLSEFVDDIWHLLTELGKEECYNSVAITSIRFLAATASNPIHKSIFADEEALQTICEQVIIPNMLLTELDEENFEINATEYIRRDVEGSDSETRRRTAYDLVKALCRSYEKEVTDIYTDYVARLLDEYKDDPEGAWKSKDVAVYLVTAMAAQRGGAAQKRNVHVSEFVDVLGFYDDHIMPELTDKEANPVLVADSLKYAITFCMQLSMDHYNELIPILLKLLLHESEVVVSYACICIDKLLAVQDEDKKGRRVARVTAEDIEPMLDDMLTNLFAALNNDEDMENEYIMKAILRVAAVAQDRMAPYSQVVIDNLKDILKELTKNSRNPQYHNALFETVAAMITFICSSDPGTIEPFEDMLWEPFEFFLVEAEEGNDFMPYMYQLLSQLLEMRRDNVPERYQALIPDMLKTDSWEATGNIPGLTRMLSAVLHNDSSVLLSEKRLVKTLGAFQYMFAHNAYVEYSFELLTAVMAYADIEQFGEHVDQVFKMVIKRLKKVDRASFVARPFSLFLAKFIALHGEDVLFGLDDIKQGLILSVINTIFLPQVRKFEKPLDRKAVCAGMLKIVTACSVMVTDDDYLEAWGDVLYALLQVLELPPVEDTEGTKEVEVEYASKHVQLAYAKKPELDVVGDIDIPLELARGLKDFSAKHPGVLQDVVEAKLDEEAMDVLMSYFEEARVSEPFLE